MRRYFLLVLLLWSGLSHSQTRHQTKSNETILVKQDFTIGNQTFLLNGKPFLIRAGEIHYPRIPKPYWDHRIKMLKAMGMNTVCIYLFWNYHEQQQGIFAFSGDKDVAEFVRLVQANGMYCILRPGPYACAEWDMGGLPWWLLKKEGLHVRTKDDQFFMSSTKKYMKRVGKELASLQIQNGGPIIMLQVENEYGVFGKDAEYMSQIREVIRSSGFDKVQLMRCDWSSTFNLYKTAPDVAVTLNFGAGSDVDKEFSEFRKINPTAPLMCSEYWTGWFDNWGRPHETRSIESFIGSLKDMLDRKISFSLYMAHGGTTFGQWGGANSPAYSPMVTSYDYNAPIDEQGRPTDKFYAVRDLLKNYLNPGEILGEVPEALPVVSLPEVKFSQVAPLFANLGKGAHSDEIKPMEYFNQGWGRINYRTTLLAAKASREILVRDVHDWAEVFLDGKLLGKLDRRRGDSTIIIPPTDRPGVLDILVEATGRVNFGEAIIDPKGITSSVDLIANGQRIKLRGWQVNTFPVDYAFQKKQLFSQKTATGPAWYRAQFNTDKIGDSYLDMSSWGKGMVWLNGHNLGRFWKIGPQQTLFVPACWLNKGSNELIVLDLEIPANAMTRGLEKPIIDQINPDQSLLSRKAGETLDLSGEVAQVSGQLPAQGGWTTVKFPENAAGRYLCIEALSGHNPKDLTSAIAEIQLIGSDGKDISTLSWKIVYADSEEITAGNHAADRVFDHQESTYWSSQTTGKTAGFPHHLVIDLGTETKVSSLRYLSPSSVKKGIINDYKIYLKKLAFKIK